MLSMRLVMCSLLLFAVPVWPQGFDRHAPCPGLGLETECTNDDKLRDLALQAFKDYLANRDHDGVNDDALRNYLLAIAQSNSLSESTPGSDVWLPEESVLREIADNIQAQADADPELEQIATDLIDRLRNEGSKKTED